MQFDDPKARLAFRMSLAEIGYDEVRFRLGAGKYNADKTQLVQAWLADFEKGATVADELLSLSDQIRQLESRFVSGGSISGLFLPAEFSATFEALFVTAQNIVREELGAGSPYYLSITRAYQDGKLGMMGGPTLASNKSISEMLDAAAKHLVGKKQKAPRPSSQEKPAAYVASKRIEELKSLSSSTVDFKKLIRLCEELNIAFENQCFYSTAMLVRSIIDHVPPAFGFKTFNEVSNNYGTKSFKASMDLLNRSMRNVADGHLHTIMRSKEMLPTEQQVDIRRELDLLLSEIIGLH